MIWGLELFFSISFGYEFVNLFVMGSVDPLCCFCIGIPIGFSFFSIIAFLISINKNLDDSIGTKLIMFFGLFSVMLMVINTFFRKSKKISINPLQLISILLPTIFICFLFYISYYFNRIEFRSCVLPDHAFHESVIQSFLHGVNSKRKYLFDLRNILVSYKNLTYPFLPDYHVSVLIGTGHCPIRMAHLITSYLLTFSIITGFYYLSMAITKSHLVSIISMFLFLNIGGIGFLLYEPKYIDAKNTWIRKYRGRENMWFHIVLDMIIPQRSSLYGFPHAFWAMYLLIKSQNNDWKKMFIAGLLVGFLPQIQSHAYLAMAIWSFLYCVTLFITRKNKFKQFFCACSYGLGSVFMAIPLMLPLLLHATENKFINLTKTWLNYGYKNPFILWWNSLGLFFIISLFIVWPFITKKQLIIYYPSVLIFVLCTFYKFQPWETDNVKIIVNGFITTACPLVSSVISKLLTYPKRRAIQLISYLLFAIVLLGMTVSSLLCYSWAIISDIIPERIDEISLIVKWIEENTSPKAVFANAPHSITAPSLAGRTSFLSNEPVALSHGLINYGQLDDIAILCDFWYDKKIYRKAKVNYFINMFGDSPLFKPKDDFTFWSKVYQDQYFEIWKNRLPLYYI